MANPKSTLDVINRIYDRCERIGSCLVYRGQLDAGGYGRIKHKGRSLPCHRLVYERVFGPIPTGLHIDHVRVRGCRHRACCEPSHLEAVTHAENLKRSRQTFCSRGHRLNENLSPWYLKRGQRRCLICLRDRSRADSAKIRQRLRSEKVGADNAPFLRLEVDSNARGAR